MSILDLFNTAKSLEQDGIALEYDETTIVIARAGGSNKRYERRVEQLMRPHRQAAQRGRLPKAKQEEIVRKAFSETVVLAWEKMPDPANPEVMLEFSPGNVQYVFEQMPDLFDDVVEQATSVANFIAEAREDDAKS